MFAIVIVVCVVVGSDVAFWWMSLNVMVCFQIKLETVDHLVATLILIYIFARFCGFSSVGSFGSIL